MASARMSCPPDASYYHQQQHSELLSLSSRQTKAEADFNLYHPPPAIRRKTPSLLPGKGAQDLSQAAYTTYYGGYSPKQEAFVSQTAFPAVKAAAIKDTTNPQTTIRASEKSAPPPPPPPPRPPPPPPPAISRPGPVRAAATQQKVETAASPQGLDLDPRPLSSSELMTQCRAGGTSSSSSPPQLNGSSQQSPIGRKKNDSMKSPAGATALKNYSSTRYGTPHQGYITGSPRKQLTSPRYGGGDISHRTHSSTPYAAPAYNYNYGNKRAASYESPTGSKSTVQQPQAASSQKELSARSNYSPSPRSVMMMTTPRPPPPPPPPPNWTSDSMMKIRVNSPPVQGSDTLSREEIKSKASQVLLSRIDPATKSKIFLSKNPSPSSSCSSVASTTTASSSTSYYPISSSSSISYYAPNDEDALMSASVSSIIVNEVSSGPDFSSRQQGPSASPSGTNAGGAAAVSRSPSSSFNREEHTQDRSESDTAVKKAIRGGYVGTTTKAVRPTSAAKPSVVLFSPSSPVKRVLTKSLLSNVRLMSPLPVRSKRLGQSKVALPAEENPPELLPLSEDSTRSISVTTEDDETTHRDEDDCAEDTRKIGGARMGVMDRGELQPIKEEATTTNRRASRRDHLKQSRHSEAYYSQGRAASPEYTEKNSFWSLLTPTNIVQFAVFLMLAVMIFDAASDRVKRHHRRRHQHHHHHDYHHDRYGESHHFDAKSGEHPHFIHHYMDKLRQAATATSSTKEKDASVDHEKILEQMMQRARAVHDELISGAPSHMRLPEDAAATAPVGYSTPNNDSNNVKPATRANSMMMKTKAKETTLEFTGHAKTEAHQLHPPEFSIAVQERIGRATASYKDGNTASSGLEF